MATDGMIITPGHTSATVTEKISAVVLVGWLFALGVAMGLSAVNMLNHLTGGDWGVVLRRVFEASGRTLPLFLLLAVPLFYGIGEIYPWAEPGVTDPASPSYDELIAKKGPFLNREAFIELGELFGERPVVLSFVYYECPMLCSLTLNGLASTLSVTDFDVGRELDVVVVSFDPGEDPGLARQAEARTLDRYGRSETAPGWHFLTGGAASIARLTEAAGFEYTYLPESGEYAHTSGLLVVTPQGRISKYFYGIEYPPRDVRLALVEASSNQIGTAVDQLLLYCFRFNPELGKYTVATMRILRLTGAVFVAGLFIFLWTAFRRERVAGGAA